MTTLQSSIFVWYSLTIGVLLTQHHNDNNAVSDDSMASLTLKTIPHRIRLSGDEVFEELHNTERRKNDDTQFKFTYELIEPSTCELFKPPFGCCWDNHTVAVGPNGEGCPVCKDEKRSCKKWKDHCNVGAIRNACPQTCKACPKKTKKCTDTADQAEYCSLYARFGLCKREQIRVHCRNTCGACTSNDVI